MQITVLGCGPSSGVPFYNNLWGNCDPHDLKNVRTRSSIFVETIEVKILIDTGPDLRQQLLREQIFDIDCVLYTHDHADHTHGIDDLRGISAIHKQKVFPFYGDEITVNSLMKRFYYLMPQDHFEAPQKTFPSFMEPHIITGDFLLKDVHVQAFDQDHGYSRSLGFRLNDFAYSTDVVNLDENAFRVLEGVKVWIVDALAYEEHAVHAHLSKTLSWIDRVKPERAYLTHMSGKLDYETLCNTLPSHVRPCYDGLRIDL